MRRTTEREMEAVLRLDGPKRFSHFVKRVADGKRAWGLWNDGWALMAIADGSHVFPPWPASEYAELHRTGDGAGYEAREIRITDLLDDLIPKLAERCVLPGVFPTPNGKGVTPTPEELATALRNELELRVGESDHRASPTADANSVSNSSRSSSSSTVGGG